MPTQWLNVEALLRPIEPGRNPDVDALESDPKGAGRSYEYEYRAIEEALEEILPDPGNPYAREPKPADWNAVLKICAGALVNESKDLKLCAWLIEALGRLRGLDGLREGFDAIRQLQEAYWDSAYPRIENGDLSERRHLYLGMSDPRSFPLLLRGMPLTEGGSSRPYSQLDFLDAKKSEELLKTTQFEDQTKKAEWIEARTNTYKKIFLDTWNNAASLTETSFYEKKAADLREAYRAFKQWESSTDRLFDKKPPSLSEIDKAFSECAMTVADILKERRNPQGKALSDDMARIASNPFPAAEKKKPDHDSGLRPIDPARSDAGDSTDQPGPDASAATSEDGPADETAPPSDKESAISRIVKAAEFLRGLDRDNPASYLVLRGLRAGQYLGGKKPAEAPRSETRSALASAATEGNWEKVADLAEQALASDGQVWLDAQRFAIEALDALGQSMAADACRGFLAMLLNQRPDLIDETFDDDIPQASPETRAWISENLPRGTSGAAPVARAPEPATPPPTAAPPPPASKDEELEAKVALKLDAKDVEGAIRLLNAAVVAARSDRERFQWTLRLAEVCLDSENATLAAPLLDDLAAAINERRLDSWEGSEFCARVARVRFRCLKELGSRGGQHLLEDAYAQLVRLDPVAALNIDRDW